MSTVRTAATAQQASGGVDDDLWSAIGDPTRRRMLDLLLADGPSSATGLSARLPVTRQAVAKHLIVLDRVGLVRADVVGREKHYDVDTAQLERALTQLAAVGAAWDRRLQRIKRIAESIADQAQRRSPGAKRLPGEPREREHGNPDLKEK